MVKNSRNDNILRTVMFLFMLIYISAGSAFAATNSGTITVTTWYPENSTADIDDYTDWLDYETLELAEGETATSLGMKIKLSEISTTGKVAMIIVNNEAIAMKADDEEIYESKKVKISLDKIDADGSSTGTKTTTSDDCVDVYIKLPDGTQKSLTKNGDNPDKLNLANYNTDEWWETGSDNDEVYVYVERVDTDASITLKSPVSDGAWERENDYDDDENLVRFTLKDNEVYSFTVEYETTGSWGSTVTEEDVYAISVTGLGESSSSSSSSSSTTSEDLLTSTTKSGKIETEITYYTTVDGEWEASPTEYDVTGTKIDDKYKWTFYFYESGTYPVKFTAKDGRSGTVSFKVSEPTTASQVTTTTSSDNDKNSTILIIVGAVVLIGVALFMMSRKGGKGGRDTFEEVGGRIG